MKTKLILILSLAVLPTLLFAQAVLQPVKPTTYSVTLTAEQNAALISSMTKAVVLPEGVAASNIISASVFMLPNGTSQVTVRVKQ